MPSTFPVSPNSRYAYFLLFLLFFVSYGYFFQGGGWNQNARISLTRAIIHHGSFTIDYFREDADEMDFVNTGDWAFYKGHYYSNKSPGLSFVAVPFFALAEYCLRSVKPDDAESQVLFSAYVSSVCTTAFLSALLALLIFHVLHHFFQLSIRDAFVLTLFYGFGTIAFSYSTTFYCHQPAAFCSFLSFVLVMHIRRGTVFQKQWLWVLLAGFCAASAVLLEPSALLLLVAVFTYLVCSRESRKYFPLFLLGCVPPGIVQCAYNSICFGHPLASSYSYANDAVMWKVEGRLFGVPSPRRLLQLLFSPYRGLFVSSPILLMSLTGIVFSVKTRRWRAEAILCSGAALLFIVFIASFYAWHGGSAIGPRYLLPVVPFIFFLTVFAFRNYPKTVTVLGVVSLLINLSVTLVGNEIPRTVGNPLRDVIWKNLLEGRVSINPVPFSHFENYPIDTLADMGQWTPNSNAFNLGEFLFPHSLASMLPLIVFWIVWWYFLWRRVPVKRGEKTV